MKKSTSALINSLLLVIAIACNNVTKLWDRAPDMTNTVDTTNTVPQAAEINKVQDIYQDVSNATQRKQLINIRVCELQNRMVGKNANQTDHDIKSEVRGKLEQIYRIAITSDTKGAQYKTKN